MWERVSVVDVGEGVRVGRGCLRWERVFVVGAGEGVRGGCGRGCSWWASKLHHDERVQEEIRILMRNIFQINNATASK